jgi:hypothetical protein
MERHIGEEMAALAIGETVIRIYAERVATA